MNAKFAKKKNFQQHNKFCCWDLYRFKKRNFAARNSWIVKATTWHADETYIKIKGNGYWLWIVYDKLGVLAWHISKKRKIQDARIVLQKALQVAGTKPVKIITDGLKQYCFAIKKVIGWNWRVQKEKHIVSSGIGRNWFIERLNREIKRRIKWFSTFQSIKGDKAFFGLWFYHFNQRKSSHISWLHHKTKTYKYNNKSLLDITSKRWWFCPRHWLIRF